MRNKMFLRLCIGIPVMLLANAASADGSGKWQSGKEAYSKVCAFCHERGLAPVIKGTGKSPELIRILVRAGNRAMPAFRPTEIDDATLARIAEYLK